MLNDGILSKHLCWRRALAFRLKRFEESLEVLFVGVVVGFPGAQVGDEELADFDGGVFADFGVEAFPFFEGLEAD